MDLVKEKRRAQTACFAVQLLARLWRRRISRLERGRTSDTLVDVIARRLDDSSPTYDEDVLTDRPERFSCVGTDPRKVLKLTEEEVPHSVAVEIEEYKSPDEYPERNVLYIRAALLVERPGQKGILLGEKGEPHTGNWKTRPSRY